MSGDKELYDLREKVYEKLYWIKEKTNTLTKDECLILLRNEDIYRRKFTYCFCCGLSICISGMEVVFTKVTRRCMDCAIKGLHKNYQYALYEIDDLNNIVIHDHAEKEVKYNDMMIYQSFKEKIIKQFDKFVNDSLASSNSFASNELSNNLTSFAMKERNIITKFFEDFPFERDTAFSLDFHQAYKNTVLAAIRFFLIDLKSEETKLANKFRIEPRFSKFDYNQSINEVVEIEPSPTRIIRIKGILLDRDEVEKLKHAIATSILNEQKSIKDNFIEFIKMETDQYRSTPIENNIFESIKKVYETFMKDYNINY